jgi:GntR family transcriptional regulator
MPLYAQLTRAIQFAIATGRLQIGEQLPTVRQLAVELRVNANTVAKVYAELERSGVLETRRGVGTFVCARHYEANSRHDHETSLRELVDRFMEEAAALGFTSDDLLDQLQSRRKKETKKNVQHYESNSNQKQSAVDKYTTR